MNLPKRKQLRVQSHNYASCAMYFVTICTHNRQRLFGEPTVTPTVGAALCGRPHQTHQMLEKWLREIENKFPTVTLDESIIMPDHIHVLLFIHRSEQSIDLLTVMDWFKTMTTNEYIRQVKAGTYPPFEKAVWQRGYYEHIVRNEQDLLETRKYIADNPKRWLIKQTDEEK